MNAEVLVLAKEPVAGRVKTRLCPPCTAAEAARIAAAALADTLDAVGGVGEIGRTLVLDGRHPAPSGWSVVPQRGGPLDARLAAAFADTRRPGVPSLLIGMDTPQVTSELLTGVLGTLTGVDAALGLAVDGGWWALGLREPRQGTALLGVPTSTATTGRDTLAALRARGLGVVLLPELRDVDTAADAHTVADACPLGSRFARAVTELMPRAAGGAS
ncbi:MAG TPA: DUF2064 domain-containing protein [Actinoplanes sp.]